VPLQVVASQRLYRQIAGQIAGLIDSGEFAVGSRLPPERELAVLLGVSRTSVREAILALEIEGRVEVRVGTGIFVTAAAVAPAQADGPGPFDLLAARELIEGEAVALAATRIDDDALARLRATIETMRRSDDELATRAAADREFHTLIAEASGNGAYPLLVGALWDQRRGGLWARIETHFHTPALRARTLDDHAAILAALEQRDAAAARAAMVGHLQHVACEFQRRWDALDVPAPAPGASPAGAPAATQKELQSQSRSARRPAAGRSPTGGLTS
jgi:DNA-binding FadR family transcriptional regulator